MACHVQNHVLSDPTGRRSRRRWIGIVAAIAPVVPPLADRVGVRR
jgi:hypothetical protein